MKADTLWKDGKSSGLAFVQRRMVLIHVVLLLTGVQLQFADTPIKTQYPVVLFFYVKGHMHEQIHICQDAAFRTGNVKIYMK